MRNSNYLQKPELMYWEEYIELIKKSFTPTEFSIPYTDWVDILKKIENIFIIKANSNDHFSNWADTIKKKIEVTVVDLNALKTALMPLSHGTNYWEIFPVGRGPSAKNYVYACNLHSLLAMVQMCKGSPYCSGSFFIVDKKYSWFTYFCVSEENNNVSIYKSGEFITPFDTSLDTDRVRPGSGCAWSIFSLRHLEGADKNYEILFDILKKIVTYW